MYFASGSQIKGKGGFRPRQRRKISQIVAESMIHNNSLSLHGQNPNNNQPSQEKIEKIADAKIRSNPSNYHAVPDYYTGATVTASKLPGEIPAGETGWQFFFAYGGLSAGEPNVTGTYVLRHNLPGTYTVTATSMTLGASTTVDVNGVSMTRIEVTNINTGNCWIDVSGPVGAFPADWDIQLLRESDEASFDNTLLPVWHPTRYFIPEFLAFHTTWKSHSIRFMKSLRTEISDKNNLTNFPGPTDRVSRNIYPIEVCVGLCNYIGCGGWFNFPMAATDELIDHWCDVIIANMDANLPVIFGHGNEHWNLAGYPSLKYYIYEGMKQFGIQGSGTMTFDGTTFTGTGTEDLTTLFGADGSAVIAIDHPSFDRGGFSYTIDKALTTATTLTVHPATDDEYRIAIPGGAQVNWYHNSPSSYQIHDRGYMYRSTLAMKRVTDKFTAADQMGRLVRMYEVQQNNTATANAMWNAGNFWTGPGSLDPKQYHDGIAVSPYFGGGIFKPAGANSGNVAKELLRDAADADDQAEYNKLMRDANMGYPIPGFTPHNRLFEFMKRQLSWWQNKSAENGMGLWTYEGGTHVISNKSFNGEDQSIINKWRPFLDSPEALEVFEAWRDSQIPYLNGPIIKFQTFGTVSFNGVYGMIAEGYNEDTSNNKEFVVLENIRQMEPFWLPENPPVAVPVPDQSWAAGVQPIAPHDDSKNFSLFDYVSMNATSFGATSAPPGMTVNSTTGEVTGSPVAGSGAYVFTASNGAGSVNIPINITVT